MGGVDSKQVTDVAQSVMSEKISNILQENETNSTITISADQDCNVSFGAGSIVQCTDPPGTPVCDQTTDMEVTIINEITQKTTNNIKTLLEQESNVDSEMTQEILAELGGPKVDTEQMNNIMSNVKTSIEDNITQMNLQNMASNISLNQNGQLSIGRGVIYTGPCTIKQDISATIISQSISGSIMSNTAVSDAIQKATTETSSTQDVTSAGPSLFDIGGGLIALLVLLFIMKSFLKPFIILVILGGIGFTIWYFVFRDKDEEDEEDEEDEDNEKEDEEDEEDEGDEDEGDEVVEEKEEGYCIRCNKRVRF